MVGGGMGWWVVGWDGGGMGWGVFARLRSGAACQLSHVF